MTFDDSQSACPSPPQRGAGPPAATVNDRETDFRAWPRRFTVVLVVRR
jgi:hypothetical protein